MAYLEKLRKKNHLSERELAARAHIARTTLRLYEKDIRRAKLQHLEAIARILNQKVVLGLAPQSTSPSEFSIVATSCSVVAGGFESWRVHLMNFVDEFRRNPDFTQILLPPISSLDPRLAALFSSVVVTLCNEVSMEPPEWANREIFLERPWFVSGIESLKATAIFESPRQFRRNNIFVHENFLARA